MYGVIALFDEETEKEIRSIWQELHDQALSFYAYEVKDRIPHITLASYENLQVDSFTARMEDVYRQQKAIDITLSTLGSFLGSGALFLAPVITEELTGVHKQLYQSLSGLGSAPSTLYTPGNWIPHCTLANRLSEEHLKDAFSYCQKRNAPIIGKVTEIALIKVEAGEAPVIFSIKLKQN